MGHSASRVAAHHTNQQTMRRDMGETQHLLQPDPEQVDNDGCFPPHGLHDLCPVNPYADLPVYTTIHRIRRDIIEAIDDPYSIEQLRDPRMNISIVRPLVDKFYENQDVSMVYCLLVNRVKFQKELLAQPHQQSVCTTRALLCELLANRILRRFQEDHQGTQGLLLLSQILVGGFDPFQGAPAEVRDQDWDSLSWARTGNNRRLPALEIAIITESKIFLSSAACQNVVSAIYQGRVIYTPTSFMDILPDHYKQKPISLYNPRQAPIFNQYRLMVPRTRNYLEVCQFVILLVLYLFVMVDRSPDKIDWVELVFIFYTMGWALDQFASILEHGWHVYTQNLWSFLDVTFSMIFWVYLVLRVHGWRTENIVLAQQAMDVLAMGAPVLVPRLAFNLMSENMLFVSLRAMMRDFAVLTLLSVWCFTGFLLSMIWLSTSSDLPHEPITISKWMLWVWFGLDGTGIQRSVDFHWVLGPILMVAFAFLGNTLFLTILVSMLSTTFSTIVSNATAEIQFRRAVLTLEGVKSDAIFAYQPPFNLLAIIVLIPLKFILTPRWFHKINVAAVRTLNAPILLVIGVIERRTLWSNSSRPQDAEQLPKVVPKRPSLWARGFSVHGDIEAVFDAEAPESVEHELRSNNDLNPHALGNQFARAVGKIATPKPGLRRTSTGKSRRDSVAPFAGMGSRMRVVLDEDDDEDGSGVEDRLKVLEMSTKRIEGLLERLLEEVDEGMKESTSSLEAKDGEGIEVLDKSGRPDMDD